MIDYKELRSRLTSIDKKDYGAYQSLKDEYYHEDFTLIIDQIPKDPYAPPHTGMYRIVIPFDFTNIPEDFSNLKIREIAYRDFLARRFFDACQRISGQRRGTGYSGIITIAEPGQTILERSSIVIENETIEARFFMGLPAKGRIITSNIAEKMFFDELPLIVTEAFGKDNINSEILKKHLDTSEDCQFLRSHLDSMNLVSFIANDSMLPRESGTSDKPLKKDLCTNFTSPNELEVSIELPHRGSIRGMGISKGITLIIGGGYHGKSTVLQTIEQAIYNHIPDDGREYCATNNKAVKIRAYSGRSVANVDISTFIKNLPGKKDTKSFSTENASGSTSQAATIQEYIEAGAKILLMDEDTCATNFMIRDEKMQKLVHKENEPITTYIDKAKQLFKEKEISSILVLGGAGDYFDIADRVIQMIDYIPFDVTERAKEISESTQSKRKREDEGYPITPARRTLIGSSIDPYNDHKKLSFYAKEVHRIYFGKTIIDLTDIEQLIELSQTKAIMNSLVYLQNYVDKNQNLKDNIDNFMKHLNEEGLDVLSEKPSGHFAHFRDLELIGTINRIRNIKISQR